MDATAIIIAWAKEKFKIELQKRDAVKILLSYLKELKPGYPVKKHQDLMEKALLAYIKRRHSN